MDISGNSIYFNSVDEIFKNYNEIENSKVGANSNIFKFSDSKVIKLFKQPPTEEHLKILNYFNKKYNGTLFLKPVKFVLIDNQICGYILKFFKGNMLENLDDNILLNDLFESFNNIDKEIELVSSNNIYMGDISKRNIMYDDKKSKLAFIDYGNYKIMDIDKPVLLRRNKNETLQAIIFAFITKYQYNEVGNFTWNKILEGASIKESLYFVKNYVEEMTQKNIDTVKDLKEQTPLLLKLK